MGLGVVLTPFFSLDMIALFADAAEEDMANKPDAQNARAVMVINRVSNKLTGANPFLAFWLRRTARSRKRCDGRHHWLVHDRPRLQAQRSARRAGPGRAAHPAGDIDRESVSVLRRLVRRCPLRPARALA